MSGMGPRSLSLLNPVVVALFHHAVFVNAVSWIIGVALVVLIGASLARGVGRFNLSEAGLAEPRARTFLRLAFGALWLFDGILQFQASMPLGLANNVVAPAAAGTPSWLDQIIHDAVGLWNTHPIALATGTAWLQVGLGILLLVSNASVGRAAAAVSVGWALLIWVVGNGAGGVFQSGASFLFGWPGATLFYAAAGVWLAVPPDVFRRRFKPVTLRALAVLAALAAVLQCLPRANFWHGGNSNALATMTASMTQTAQPHLLAWIVARAGTLAGTMGGGFNVVVLLWLLASAVGMWRAASRPSRWASYTFAIGCVVTWVIAQDTAVFGGLATDVNSMLPIAALAWCATPTHADEPLARRLPAEMRSSTGSVLAAFAAAMVAFSVVTMGVATMSGAEDTLFLAQNGPAQAVNARALPFTLTDQSGARFTLGEHRGRYTLLAFLDPRCWTDCPLIAAQLARVEATLGPGANLDLVAIAINPYHETLADLRHFIEIHNLGRLRHFYYVTGPLPTMRKIWSTYGEEVTMKPTDKMAAHNDIMYIIDPHLRIRWFIPNDPLASQSGQSSTVQVLDHLLTTSGVRS
jgi:cytochrome oxidase Cu insertion factor (SCO1/SenC/PrrC family)